MDPGLVIGTARADNVKVQRARKTKAESFMV